MDKTRAAILVVEDEPNLGSTLSERLEQEGFATTWVKSAQEALSYLSHHPFDLALLDVGLPDGSGFSIAEAIRTRSPKTAMIFLTAFGTPEDRIRGLELGAEDYIVKPFHLKELLLRVQNGLKRTHYLTAPASRPEPVTIGQAKVFFSRFEARVNGLTIPLSHKEAALLRLFVDRQGKVVSRDEILNQIWSPNEYPTSRTVDNFIVKLRKLVETDPENPVNIRSIRGVGYQLAASSKEGNP